MSARKAMIAMVIMLMGVILLGSISTSAKVANIGLVTSDSGLGDRSFNDMGFEGVKMGAKDLGITYKVVEPRDQAEFEEQIRALARDGGFDLIIGLGSRMADPMSRVATDYPKQKFLIIDTTVDKPNVVSVIFKEHEGSFLAGVLAGLMTTRTNVRGINPQKVVGFVGGKNMPVIRRFMGGYIQGVQYVEPLAEVLVGFTGTHTDPAKGKEYALAQIAQGADIVFQVATKTGEGVIAAAKEMNKWAIGVDADQDHIAPGFVLTSMMKRVDKAVFDVIKLVVDNKFVGGKSLIYGIKEGGVGLSPMNYTKDLIPADVLKFLQDVEKKVTAGEIYVEDYSGVFR